VRHVTDERSRRTAVECLLDAATMPVMAQQPAPGQYARCRACSIVGAWSLPIRACPSGPELASVPQPV
jgi:hypothetical protein